MKELFEPITVLARSVDDFFDHFVNDVDITVNDGRFERFVKLIQSE